MRLLRFDTPLGPMIAVGDDDFLRGLYFSGQKHQPDFSALADGRDCLLLRRVQHQVSEFFQGRRRGFDVPLQAPGTELQQAVWLALASIPLGETLSYSALAERVGKPRAVRAVAGAVGRNPWTLIRPCHRVIGSSGSLTGFAGGLERKAALLAHESRLAHTHPGELGAAGASTHAGLPQSAEVRPMRAPTRPASSA